MVLMATALPLASHRAQRLRGAAALRQLLGTTVIVVGESGPSRTAAAPFRSVPEETVRCAPLNIRTGAVFGHIYFHMADPD